MRKLLFAIVLTLGCGSTSAAGDAPAGAGAGAGSDAGSGSDAGGGVIPGEDSGAEAGPPSLCPRKPGPDDGDRFVVVSHPFTASGAKGQGYEVLKLTSEGTLTRTGTTFSMGMASEGEIAFTPDGRIGIVAQPDDGSIGVFEIQPDGSVRVVHASYGGTFYAKNVHIDATGTRVLILDTQIAKNGGGVYEAQIGCDGALTGQRKLAETEAVGALGAFHATPGRYLAAAGAAFGATDADTHVVDTSAGIASVAKAKVFTEPTIITSIAMSQDDQVGLMARSNAISGPTEVAVVSFRSGTLEKQAALPIEMPAVILASPFGNAFFLTTVDPDAFYLLSYDGANAAAPVVNKGALTYKFGHPQLPGAAVQIARGKLKGRIFVAEVSAVRSLQFTPAGGIDETAKFAFPSGTENIVGAIGVTP